MVLLLPFQCSVQLLISTWTREVAHIYQIENRLTEMQSIS